MRVIIDRALFEPASEQEAADLLSVFLTTLQDGCHHAILTNPPYIAGQDSGPADRWLQGRHRYEAESFRRLLQSSLLLHAALPQHGPTSDTEPSWRWFLDGPLTIHVERRPDSDWPGRILTLADTASLLREPCHLVLEDEHNDRAFVRFLAGATDGAALQGRLDLPGRVTIHSGGCGAIKRWLQSLVSQDPPPVEARRRVLRTWVLLDKDSGNTDARELSRDAKDIVALCKRIVGIFGNGLSFVCLQRREWESYAPDQALMRESTSHHKPFVNQVIAWRGDPNRRDWAWSVDIKMGLHGDLRHDLDQAMRAALNDKKAPLPLDAHMLKAPFVMLNSSEIQAMQRGLGEKRLTEALHRTPVPAWVSDLPAEYDRGPDDQAPRHALIRSLLDRM